MEFPIKEKVAHYYWKDDLNCATTNLKILAEIFNIELSEQVINAAIGMHGAGKYGAQCGLVEGTLMFLGIFGIENDISEEVIVAHCREYAQRFESEFNSLSCAVLRPEGFTKDNPPHLCEQLTCEAVKFNQMFLAEVFSKNR